MTTFIARSGLALLLLIAGFALAGCASKDKSTPARIELIAGPTVNQGDGGGAAPIVVRLYELRDSGPFQAASFFDLEDDAKTLGSAMLGTSEYELVPGQTLAIPTVLTPDTRYFGVVAAFRNIEDAHWRDIAAITPGKGAKLTVRVNKLDVRIEKSNSWGWRIGK